MGADGADAAAAVAFGLGLKKPIIDPFFFLPPPAGGAAFVFLPSLALLAFPAALLANLLFVIFACAVVDTKQQCVR